VQSGSEIPMKLEIPCARALVFFSAVEYPIANADHHLLHDVVSDADTGTEVKLVPRHQIVAHMAAVDGDGRELGREIGWQSRHTVIALRDVQSIGLKIEVCLTPPLFARRRPELVAQT